MSYTANITKARVNAGGFMLHKDAFAKLKSGNVTIFLGPISNQNVIGNVTRLGVSAQGFCTCRDLYRTTTGALTAPLPLQLNDILEYNIENGNIRLISIHRKPAIHSPPRVPPSINPPTSSPDPVSHDSCEKSACQFINKINSKERKGTKVDLTNPIDWLKGAFTASAGAGNPEGAFLGINDRAKQEIEILIVAFFKTLANEVFCGQSRFEWLFSRTIHQIENAVSIHSPHTWFTFGRAQKVLNIVVKYCYVWRLCNKSKSPKFGDASWVDKWRPYLHVPVDRETMKHLSQNKTYRDLACEAGRSTLVSWKWRMDEYRYLGIQDAIRKLAVASNLDPMCYEMKNIWTA